MWKKILAFWPAIARAVGKLLTKSADAANKDGDGQVDSLQK